MSPAGGMTREAGERSPAALRAPRAMVLLLIAFWSTFAVLSALNTYLSMLSHHHSLARLIGYQLAVCGFWAACTPMIARLADRFPVVPWNPASALVHATAGLAMTVGFGAWAIAMTLTIRPFDVRTYTTFQPYFNEYLMVRLPVGLLVYVGTLGVVHAFAFHRRATERAMRAAHLERELSQARLDTLAIQLQPHFLFNALHTVSGLIRGKEHQKAISTIAGLSDLLRYALDSSGTAVVALRDELAIVRRYLEIQELRYGERLRSTFEVEPATLDAGVPRLLLQPLIENAIRHGAAVVAGPSWLSIKAARVNGALELEIRNATPQVLRAASGTGIGLKNTRARLEQLYPGMYTMDVRRVENAFELRLVLPWRPLSAEEAVSA